ncbi:crotonobetainyl-CoA:carnitine CoA-transferase CaiB-like acyl-CoA transferase [Bradyrhizobium japonicum]
MNLLTSSIRGQREQQPSFYLCANRDKKSVTVNIAKPEVREIIRQLEEDVDVFMENHEVGDLKRYGIDCGSSRKSIPA